jgi:hypothetical protein
VRRRSSSALPESRSSRPSRSRRSRLPPDDSELRAVDLDRDGLDDLILYTWSWYDSVHDIHVLMNRGDGTFSGGQIADDLELID